MTSETPKKSLSWKIWLIIGLLFAISNLGIYLYQRHQQGLLQDEMHEMMRMHRSTAGDMIEHHGKLQLMECKSVDSEL